MSKYGWISDIAEHYLNNAVKERALRWQALQTNWRPHFTKTESEHRLLDYLVHTQNNPGHNDSMVTGLVKRIKQQAVLTVNERQALESRAHKYRGSYWLRQAIWAFKNQRVENMPGTQPRSLKGHLRMKKKAGDLKRFMKEVQRRYEVVDRAHNAFVVRKGGRIDRVSKDTQEIKRSAYRREPA
jgi:hypothetical protein